MCNKNSKNIKEKRMKQNPVLGLMCCIGLIVIIFWIGNASNKQKCKLPHPSKSKFPRETLELDVEKKIAEETAEEKRLSDSRYRLVENQGTYGVEMYFPNIDEWVLMSKESTLKNARDTIIRYHEYDQKRLQLSKGTWRVIKNK